VVALHADYVIMTDLRWLAGEYRCSWRLAELAAIHQHHTIWQ